MNFQNKIKIALDFIKEGQSFPVGDLRLEIKDSNILTVTGWSRYINFSNLNKLNSLNELSEIKSLFKEMIDASNDLMVFTKDKSIIYSLYYDDMGRASIEICSEINGIIIWNVELC